MTRARPVDEFREEIAGEVERACEEVRARYLTLPGEVLGWKPGEGRWSVSECLEHLTVTNRAYGAVLGPAIERGLRRGTGPSTEFRGGPFGRWFSRMVGPQVRIKAKAPRVFRPGSSSVPAGAPQRFMRSQDEIIGLLDAAVLLDLDGIRVRSPVTPLFRFRLGDVFRIIVAHVRRHLDQAARVTEAPGFPGS